MLVGPTLSQQDFGLSRSMPMITTAVTARAAMSPAFRRAPRGPDAAAVSGGHRHGQPRHLTREAEHAIRGADLILLPHKEDNKAELAQVRLALLQDLSVSDARIAHFDMPLRRQQGDDYGSQVDEWHDAIARRWQDCLHAHLPSGTGRVALLVWGILRCMTARCGLRPAWV
jgi:hypothetical protein